MPTRMLQRRRSAARLRLQVSRLRHSFLQRRQTFDQFIIEQLAGDELAHATQANPQAALADRNCASCSCHGFSAWAPMAPPRPPSLIRAPCATSIGGYDQNRVTSLLVYPSAARNPRSSLRSDSADDYYRLRAVIEPAYDPKNWRTPDQRLLSLTRRTTERRPLKSKPKQRNLPKTRKRSRSSISMKR